jgi:preprotein translocase subunit SecY
VFKTMKNAWSIPDIRKKLIYTLFIIIIFRVGSAIAVPFLLPEKIKEWMGANSTGSILEYLNLLSGGNLSKAAIFSMSVQPFINASIIVQLLSYALPPLERLSQEGEEGRKRLNQITSVLAIILGIVMSTGYYFMLRNSMKAVKYTQGFEGVFAAVVIVACFVAGSSLIIWLGNRINEKGIGNGISMILFAGIVARFPDTFEILAIQAKNDPSKYFFIIPIVVIIFLAMIAFIVLMNNAERRIPIQYAKRVVGRKQYGGQNTHIPIKVAMSGVMPIIFASSFMQLPSTLYLFVQPNTVNPGTWDKIYIKFLEIFNPRHWVYMVLYGLLIVGFNYFYVSMQYNPIEIANNLRQSNGGIPGIRPGKPTSEFISRVLNKITLVGAVFLAIIAIFPMVFGSIFEELSSLTLGGTSILIVVSVALETVRTLESQMMMRHHKGFLE